MNICSGDGLVPSATSHYLNRCHQRSVMIPSCIVGYVCFAVTQLRSKLVMGLAFKHLLKPNLWIVHTIAYLVYFEQGGRQKYISL